MGNGNRKKESEVCRILGTELVPYLMWPDERQLNNIV